MKNNQPNIVYIIIDSLRYDRLGVSGYQPALTPNLDELALSGTNCVQHFSTGCASQFSIPGIFTSSLPFDYGGYNAGILNRPHSFVELLQKGGYQTIGLTTCHWFSSYYGVTRGFDQYTHLIDIDPWLNQSYIAQLGEPIQRWMANMVSDTSISDFLHSTYGSILEKTLEYLDDLDRVGAEERYPRREQRRREVIAEQNLLAKSPLLIADKLKVLGADYRNAMGIKLVNKKLIDKFEKKKTRMAWMNRKVFLRAPRKAYEAHTVNRHVQQHLAEERENPFFLFLHYFDLHEAKFLVPNLSFSRLQGLPIDVIRTMKGRPKGLGGRFYDVGLSNIDRRIGELCYCFEQNGLLEDTVFVITGDHGKESGFVRGTGSDLSRKFTDDFLQVPLIVKGPGVRQETVSSLMSHLDVAPTLLELAGVENPKEFLGLPLSRRRSKSVDHLIFENAGRGRCDLNEKTLYLGVRTEKVKVVFEANKFSPVEREVYDLQSDSMETKNLIKTSDLLTERFYCLDVIRKRLDSLRANLDGVSGFKFDNKERQFAKESSVNGTEDLGERVGEPLVLKELGVSPCLHVGFAKTATSTLQRSLFDRHPEVHNLGVPYRDGRMTQIRQSILTAEEDQFDAGECRKLLDEMKLLAIGSDKVLVLSDELFTYFKYNSGRNRFRVADRLRRVYGPCKILFTIRHQLRLIESYYIQTSGTKAPNYLPFSKWLEARRGDYLPLLKFSETLAYYTKIFGSENITVFLFESLLEDEENYIRKLCSFVGIDGEKGIELVRNNRVNERKSQRMVKYASFRFRFLPNHPIGKILPKQIKSPIESFIEGGPRATVEIPADWEKYLMDFYRQDNQKLVNTYALPLEQYGYPM